MLFFVGVFFVLLALLGVIGATFTENPASPKDHFQNACAIISVYLASMLAALAFAIHYEVI